MRAFNVDINTTKRCNLRCTYCFEAKSNNIEDRDYKDVESFIDFLKRFMSTEFYKTNFSHTSVNLWGGEPTINRPLYDRLLKEYFNNPNVMFLLYTNGYNIPDSLIESYKSMNGMKVKNNPKLVVQVSYDGTPIHDMARLNIKGEGSSSKVRESIQKLKDNGIFLTLKSTITPENFKYLYDAYLDVSSLSTNFGYFPSIDLHREYTDDSYKQYGDDLHNSLVKVVAHEIKHNINNFRWLQGGRMKHLCSAGADMIAVDTNGDIVPCHGTLYNNTKNHYISNVSSPNSVEEVINSIKEFRTFYNNEPDKCKKCGNNFCLRCNSNKFAVSKKESYSERWTDHDSQDYLCYFFDIVNLVYRAKRRL